MTGYHSPYSYIDHVLVSSKVDFNVYMLLDRFEEQLELQYIW
jgi:hypothetical protein